MLADFVLEHAGMVMQHMILPTLRTPAVVCFAEV